MRNTPRSTYLIFLFCAAVHLLSAQANDSIYIKKTQLDITLDGRLQEVFWQDEYSTKDFYQYFPENGGRPTYKSEMYFAFTDNHLYVGIKCYSRDDDYVVPSLRRDWQAGGSDNFTVMFDTFNDGQNSLIFGINPAGVLREGTISNGGAEGSDFSVAWDNKWKAVAYQGDQFWSAEMRIPFSTLRFNTEARTWRVGAYRFDSQTNEISTMLDNPNNQGITNLAFMKDMIWLDPITKKNKNIALIPFVSGGAIRDKENPLETEAALTSKVGGDAKIGLTTGLNLDLTINPDFSQVEVDRQVTDLDRFEIFLPERRQFFIENADLFNSFGNSRINPFFSRRIGIAIDTTTQSSIENSIIAGARVTGKINNDWRVGLINMQTQEDAENDLPSFNYTVAAVQRKLFSRSSIGLIFVNRDNYTNFDSETYSDYNRVIGLDYNLATKDNRWNGKVFFHKSFSPDRPSSEDFAHGLEINYIKDILQVGWNHQYVGENYDAEVGFVPRTNFFRINPDARLNFLLNNGTINQHGPRLEYRLFMNTSFERIDELMEFSYSMNFENNVRINLNANREYTLLVDDFELFSDQPVLAAGTDYTYYRISFNYRSDRRKPFSFELTPSIGTFFNADLVALNARVNYRFQPFGSFGIQANFNRLIVEAPFETTNLLLVGPRIDITFSRKLFLTTFFQYNNQIENFNINARLQWRFAPVSDFFIVYTDNYDTEGFVNRNKALVAKFSYWFTL